MNKKNRTLILLLGVVLIYAAIAVRFFLFNGGGTNPDAETNQVSGFSPINYSFDNTFTIDNNYRDPFLGSIPKKKTVKPTSKPAKPIKTKIEKALPKVKYLGVISDASSSRKILSLSIEDKEFIVQAGQKIEDIKIISGDDEQMNIQVEGKEIIVKLSDQ